jgi:hypothetical protein
MSISRELRALPALPVVRDLIVDMTQFFNQYPPPHAPCNTARFAGPCNDAERSATPWPGQVRPREDFEPRGMSLLASIFKKPLNIVLRRLGCSHNRAQHGKPCADSFNVPSLFNPRRNGVCKSACRFAEGICV